MYNSLPVEEYSVGEFTALAKNLNANHKNRNPREYIRFVLTGEVKGRHQAQVNPLLNQIGPRDPVSISRDYSRILGITQDIVAVNCPLKIFPVSKQADGITTSIHLDYHGLDMSPGTSTPYHKIPNARLGVWGDDSGSDDSIFGTIHVFFPGLGLDSRRPSHLSEEELKTVYEEGLRPSIARTLPEASLDWPAKYISELEPHNTPGAGGEDSHAGKRTLRSVIIPPTFLANFASNLRFQLNGVKWAQGFFFIHKVCGLNSATQHSKTTKAASPAWVDALEKAQIPIEATRQGSWWVDVGLEFHSDPGTYLQWTTVSHSLVVEKVLRVSMSAAMRMTTLGADGYSRDIACHLPDVSGCHLRVEAGIQHGGPFYAKYLELSTSEMSKALYPALTIRQAMASYHPTQFTLDMFNALRGQALATGKFSESNPARIEVRVPLQYAQDVLIDGVNERNIREFLLSFSRSEWIDFKSCRLLAISDVLDLQANSTAFSRLRHSALLLTAACVWLLNGLRERPDNSPSWRTLMEAVFPITSQGHPVALAFSLPDDDKLNAETPYYPYGVTFLRRIRLGKGKTAPRMKSGLSFPPPPVIKDLFGETKENVWERYMPQC